MKPLESCHVEAIGIIDGEFFQSLAVSPREILPFLRRGVRVYGASSIGALRAVELEKFGMRGIGRVFRLFRSGLLSCDDEVALSYCPLTYAHNSEALVDTRFALRAAVRKGLLEKAESRLILGELKSAYFPERSHALVFSIARRTLGITRARCLRDFLSSTRLGVKEADAKLLVRELIK